MRPTYNSVSNQKITTTVNILSAVNCAYIAGMIDADGSICKSKNRNHFILKVRVHNSDKNLIDWLKRTIGAGNIHYLPPSTDTKGYRHTLPRWTYDISAKVDVLRILEQIEPYLIIKQEKARQFIALIPSMKRPTKYNMKKVK